MRLHETIRQVDTLFPRKSKLPNPGRQAGTVGIQGLTKTTDFIDIRNAND
jgi:hypothetical protein